MFSRSYKTESGMNIMSWITTYPVWLFWRNKYQAGIILLTD